MYLYIYLNLCHVFFSFFGSYVFPMAHVEQLPWLCEAIATSLAILRSVHPMEGDNVNGGPL